MRRYRLMMVLAAALPLWQQLSGINTVVFYSSEARAVPYMNCKRRQKCLLWFLWPAGELGDVCTAAVGHQVSDMNIISSTAWRHALWSVSAL